MTDRPVTEDVRPTAYSERCITCGEWTEFWLCCDGGYVCTDCVEDDGE